MQVSLVYVFASEVIVKHEASEEVIAPMLHKTDLVFVPVRVSYRGSFEETFYEGKAGAQFFQVTFCALLTDVHGESYRCVCRQIGFTIMTY